jgi:hypothetical protein
MNKINYTIKNLKEQLKNGALAVTGSNNSRLTGKSQPIIPNSDHDAESYATGSLNVATQEAVSVYKTQKSISQSSKKRL